MKKNTKGTGHQSSFFYRCSLCAAGGMLMGVAAVLFLAGGNGADSMNTLLQGMSQALQLSVDACNNLLSFTFVLAAFFIDRKQIHAGTIIFPVVTTITIRILTPLIHADTLLHRVLFCMAGIGIIAMSIALSIYADCGKNPYDCVTFGLMKRTGLSYPVIRWILDGGMLVSGMILHGTYGVVTIINLLVLGRLITAALSLLNRSMLTGRPPGSRRFCTDRSSRRIARCIRSSPHPQRSGRDSCRRYP